MASSSKTPDRWQLGDKFQMSDDYKNTSTSNTNRYSEPSADRWVLRGKDYLSDGKKFPSEQSAFELVGTNVFRTQDALYHSASNIKHLQKWLSERDGDFLVVSWILPGPPFHTVVHVFRRRLPVGADPVFDDLLEQFKKGGEEFQKERFKFLCLVPEAPWALKVAVASLGGERPVILCKKLESQHFSGPNYFEIDVSIASSKIATMLNSIVIRAGKTVMVDMGFTIEGQNEAELPERILATVRWHFCAIDDIAIVLDAEGFIKSMEVSKPYISYLDGGSDAAIEEAIADDKASEADKTIR